MALDDDDSECPAEVQSDSTSTSNAVVFTQANVATWVLIALSGVFLAARLWCRHRFSKLWWDDALLVVSWVCRAFNVLRSWTLTGLNRLS